MMDWKEYEIYITKHFQKVFPDASITHDVKRKGILSAAIRQIDILIEDKVAGFGLTIAVECKYFNRKINVKDMDAFVGFLQDVKVSKEY